MNKTGENNTLANLEYEYNEADGMYYPKLDYPAEENIQLGRLGRMRFDFLRDSNHVLYAQHMMNGTIMRHCKEVEEEARRRIDVIVDKIMSEYPDKDKKDFELTLKRRNTAQIEAEGIVIREYIIV